MYTYGARPSHKFPMPEGDELEVWRSLRLLSVACSGGVMIVKEAILRYFRLIYLDGMADSPS